MGPLTVVAFVATGLAWALSLVVFAWWDSGGATMVSLGRGAFRYQRAPAWRGSPGPAGWRQLEFERPRLASVLRGPRVGHIQAGDWTILVPMWLPVAGVAGIALVRARTRRRCLRPTDCRRCGYDLSGAAPGSRPMACPECGAVAGVAGHPTASDAGRR